MDKIKRQRIYSKTSGIRHRMVFKNKNRYYILFNHNGIEVEHISKDLWRVK